MRMHAEWEPRAWAVVIAAAFLLMLAVNPVGFIGGGADDWQYLNAARCWREFGPCLPHDHWQSRWPVVAPLAFITATLGESRATVQFAPLVESAACLFLLAAIGNRAFGKPVGWIAALLFIAVPTFAVEALEPAVEPIELALILGGTLAAMHWIEKGDSRWAFVAGLLLSLAIQVRETAVVAALMVALFGVYRRRPALFSLVAATGAFAIPFAIEFIWMGIATGDPFWRLRLAVRHVQIPSSELLGPIDRSRPPFFNRNYIENWRFVPGIHIYWAVNGLANLFVDAFAGFSLALTVVLASFCRGRLGREHVKYAVRLWLAALCYCCVLIYAFAIDPKPRMFMPALACSNLALAILTWSLWRCGSRALVVAVWTTTAIVGTAYVYATARTAAVDDRARSWIEAHPGEIETNRNTWRTLALVDVARSLPPLGSGRSLMLFESESPCAEWSSASNITRNGLVLVAEAQRSRLRQLYPELGHSLCLFRYRGSDTGKQIRDLLRHRDAIASQGPKNSARPHEK